MHTLLIVEDEKMIRQGIRTMVQRSGVPVDVILECNNGESALEILRSQKVDVMFTDIRMPRMNGIELIKAMQELPEPPLTVAVSGYDDFTYAVELMRMGVKEYILKPVDREQIRKIMEKLEEEINRHIYSQETSRTVGCQQLKYLLLSNNLTQAELDTNIQRCSFSVECFSSIFRSDYVVCCLNNQGGEMVLEEEIIYISNLDDEEVYLVKAGTINRFRMQEWRSRCVGASTPKRGLEQMKEGYQEAKLARMQAFWTEKAFIQYESQAAFAPKETTETVLLQPYVQMLGTAKAEQAMRQIRNFFWYARRNPFGIPAEEEINIFLSELWNAYESVLLTEKEEMETYRHPYRYPSASEYEQNFLTWLEQFVTMLNQQFEDYKNKQKIQQAVIYIRENYDKDLNMAVVSNHISMNYSLFSYAFKQYTGVNFVNYVKDIRMEKARELLEQTDLRIMEISQKIGYENEKHFMKTFKSTYGVSPSEYRKNAQYRPG